MVTEDRSRAQILLIGAIALAFIILGVVVVVNGVLYTETISSGSTGQTASTAETTTIEVERGVGCLLAYLHEDEINESDQIAANISEFSDRYQATTAQSTPSVRNISTTEDEIGIDDDGVQNATVTITYDGHDLSYNQTREIERNADCVEDDP